MDAPNTEQKPSRTISPQWITGLALLIGLFGPLSVQSFSGSIFNDFSIAAMTWIYQVNSWYGGFILNPFMIFESIPFTFMRLVFGYMLYRLYSGKTTQKRVVITGIIMELFLPVFYYITYLPILLFNPGWSGFPVLLPIPLLLLYGLAIAKRYPPPEEEHWIETDKKEYWWEQSKETEEPLKSSDTSSQSEETVLQTDGATKQIDEDWLKES